MKNPSQTSIAAALYHRVATLLGGREQALRHSLHTWACMALLGAAGHAMAQEQVLTTGSTSVSASASASAPTSTATSPSTTTSTSTSTSAPAPIYAADWVAQLWKDKTTSYELQLGADAWDLHPSVDSDTAANQKGNRMLFFANSNTAWPYQDVAPWLRFKGVVHLGADTVISAKFRADQALGSHVDEFNLDHSYYGFGARLGVVDYKTSWCRTYDANSPWVRENDPFCTTKFTGDSTSAAPGVQLYSNFVLGDFKWQALLGSYSPLVFDYDTREFSNSILDERSSVIENDRTGISFNAVDLQTGLDMRLSIMHTNQDADIGYATEPTVRMNQNGDAVYAGISFSPYPAINLRLTHLRAQMYNSLYYPVGYAHKDDTTPTTRAESSLLKTSSVVELNYQASASDVYSLAYSLYDLNEDTTTYTRILKTQAVLASYYPGYYNNHSASTAVSWRHNWQDGFFTVLQWSVAEAHSSTQRSTTAPPLAVSSYGHAIGLRLGIQL